MAKSILYAGGSSSKAVERHRESLRRRRAASMSKPESAFQRLKRSVLRLEHLILSDAWRESLTVSE